jgi:histidinol-phosphatase (PHP family)
LAHLDYPSRYIVAKFKDFDVLKYKEQINEVLKVLVSKGTGLEINLSGYRNILGRHMPHPEILKMYKNLGGELLTVGSDSHKKEHIGLFYDTCLEVLRECGFKHIAVFENRKPQLLQID